ncbi:MAG: translation initiation factor IF-2 [Candidatus Omnitrophica bacterium]|nr:translation initiation factor IF-2 [Candidatus Omnitrophota bacterium]
MRVSELAKALNMPSKELLEKLKTLRIAAKSPLSTLDADAVNRARKALKKPPVKKPSAARPAVSPARAAGPAARPAAKPAAARAAAAKPSPAKPSAASATATKTIEPPARPAAQPTAAAPKLHAAPAPKVERPAAPPLPAKPKPHAVPAPPAPAPAPVEAPPVPAGPPTRLELKFPVTVKDLASKMDVKASDLIKRLMQQKIFASIVQPLDEQTATGLARTFGFEVAPQPTLEQQLQQAYQPDPAKTVLRAPVVTFMGHVDHGKTSLLDAIREAKVAEKEAGGITQHIGAYEVQLEKGRVTFLDTPGHEAFSALRARGANVTDVVVLVVAADDGVMPQTVEAINHAKAADVPIVVAINKMDKPEANPQKVKQQLTQYGLVGEEWGGKTIMVPVSARTQQGIDELLEMLLLEAELLELKADPTMPAQGAVIEAKQTKDRGPIVTVLVQQGTLRIGDTVLMGHLVGRVRAMVDDRGHRIKEAGPARPVEVLGLPEVPQAGDRFLVVTDEKLARQLAEQRLEQRGPRAAAHPKRITLEELHQRITEGQLKDLRLIVKADVQGSLEAIVQSLEKLDTEKTEVQFRILHVAVGDITESDVILAAASDAIIVGFHVGIEPKVQVLAATEGVDVHIYQIIYELVGAIKAAIEGLLEPTIEETFVGRAEVRKLFQVSRSGLVAGCMVTKGFIRRDCVIHVIRGRERVAQAEIAGLKRLKDDVREIQEGLECGILLAGNSDVQVGDLLEAWEQRKVARKLA